MVSLDKYLDRRAAEAASKLINLYKVDFANSALYDYQPTEQKVHALKKIVDAYKKEGLDAAIDEILKLSEGKQLPFKHFISHDSKDITLDLIDKLDIENSHTFKEKIAKYCKNGGKKPDIMDKLDDRILNSYFDSLGNKLIRLKFKYIEKRIKKLMHDHYSNILDLLTDKTNNTKSLVWKNSVTTHYSEINNEIKKLNLALLKMFS